MDNIKYNARAFSRLGQSGALFGMGAVALRETYPIICIAADMSTPAGLDRFKRTYPEDFINVGIAEQNMVGIAAGLASEGFKPICVTQAAFISMRSFEMIRQYMGYMANPVIAVGLSSGFALSFLGNTHYAIEDIALMRSIPGMTVFSPADAIEAVKVLESALRMNKPAYIRLTGGLMAPIVYKTDYTYNPFKANLLVDDGDDVAIFATGSMVYQSVNAAALLAEKDISCKVYDVSCIKPIDEESIIEACSSRLLVTVEEHSVVGGLGSAVADVISSLPSCPRLLKIGVNDTFSQVGDYNYLLEIHGLTSSCISRTIELNF